MCLFFFPTQVDVQSIKWISCKGMYKGYRRVLLHEHSGDPTKQFCNVSSYFFRKKSDYVLPVLKIDLQGYTLSKEKWVPLQQPLEGSNGIVLTPFSKRVVSS